MTLSEIFERTSELDRDIAAMRERIDKLRLDITRSRLHRFMVKEGYGWFYSRRFARDNAHRFLDILT